MRIGSFHIVDDGFVGRLQTLTIDVPLRITRIAKQENDKAPDWRVHIDDGEGRPEVGSGWTHSRDRGGSFVALQLDRPTLLQPIRANLLPPKNGDDGHVLLWSRPKAA